MNYINKILICAGGQVFELVGTIVEQTDEYIILKTHDGEMYVEKKYVVFIQFIDKDKGYIQKEQKKPNNDLGMAKIIRNKLHHDPLLDKLNEEYIMPEKDEEIEYEGMDVEDDAEVTRKVYGTAYGNEHPLVKSNPPNLQQAVKQYMNNENTFTDVKHKYSNQLDTFLGKNANSKKTRND